MNVAQEAQRILLTIHKSIIVLHDVHEFKMVLNKTTPKHLLSFPFLVNQSN